MHTFEDDAHPDLISLVAEVSKMRKNNKQPRTNYRNQKKNLRSMFYRR